MSNLQKLREKCIKRSKKSVSESVNKDDYIRQTITNIEQVEDTLNSLVERIRNWYKLYFPEINKELREDREFIEVIQANSKEELMQQFDIKESMGANLEGKDLEILEHYIQRVNDLYDYLDKLDNYLKETMEDYCPNLMIVAEARVGAKLLQEAGGLKKLAMKPSNAIQLLGAEKALFRHLKTGAKPPKYGYLFHHSMVQDADEDERGKVARAIADKIALAVRADYFGEKFIGDDLKEELEERFDE